jgi:hypothetical protein
MGSAIEDIDPLLGIGLVGPIEQHRLQVAGIDELERALAEIIDDVEGRIRDQDRSARRGAQICGHRLFDHVIGTKRQLERLNNPDRSARRIAAMASPSTGASRSAGRNTSSTPASFDDIVDHCCYVWNTLIDQP